LIKAAVRGPRRQCAAFETTATTTLRRHMLDENRKITEQLEFFVAPQ
jgi:hypothetical protein